jgi:hypothetical protein
MSKHTPGPWKISDELTDDCHIVIDLGPNDGCVLIERQMPGHDSQDMPNANLIAAAPEMLEELKFLVETCIETFSREYADGGTYEVEQIEAGESTVKRIRELIARVENA